MQVKIDTREKFHVITIRETKLAANMTAELDKCLLPFTEKETKNVVLNLEDIVDMDTAAAEHLIKIRTRFNEMQSSFVICNLRPAVRTMLVETGLLDEMNIAPTESEAWDIVQMEEIERELLGDD